MAKEKLKAIHDGMPMETAGLLDNPDLNDAQRELLVDMRFDQMHAHRLELALRGIDDLEDWSRYQLVKAAGYVLGVPAVELAYKGSQKLIKLMQKRFAKYKSSILKDPDVLSWANDYFEFDPPVEDLTPHADKIWETKQHNARAFP